MKLICKGRYSNPPASLFFTGPGEIEVDERIAEILRRDAPENFALPPADKAAKEDETPDAPPEPPVENGEAGQAEGASSEGDEGKSLDVPPADKAVKEAKKKK